MSSVLVREGRAGVKDRELARRAGNLAATGLAWPSVLIGSETGQSIILNALSVRCRGQQCMCQRRRRWCGRSRAFLEGGNSCCEQSSACPVWPQRRNRMAECRPCESTLRFPTSQSQESRSVLCGYHELSWDNFCFGLICKASLWACEIYNCYHHNTFKA